MNNVAERILLETNYIKQEIIFGEHSDCIQVVDVEAGLGKSRCSEEAVVKIYNIDPTKFVIIVLKNQDCIITKDKLYLSHKRINELARRDIALGVDSLNIEEVRYNSTSD